jgi:hypothetical protein
MSDEGEATCESREIMDPYCFDYFYFYYLHTDIHTT